MLAWKSALFVCWEVSPILRLARTTVLNVDAAKEIAWNKDYAAATMWMGPRSQLHTFENGVPENNRKELHNASIFWGSIWVVSPSSYFRSSGLLPGSSTSVRAFLSEAAESTGSFWAQLHSINSFTDSFHEQYSNRIKPKDKTSSPTLPALTNLVVQLLSTWSRCERLDSYTKWNKQGAAVSQMLISQMETIYGEITSNLNFRSVLCYSYKIRDPTSLTGILWIAVTACDLRSPQKPIESELPTGPCHQDRFQLHLVIRVSCLACSMTSQVAVAWFTTYPSLCLPKKMEKLKSHLHLPYPYSQLLAEIIIQMGKKCHLGWVLSFNTHPPAGWLTHIVLTAAHRTLHAGSWYVYLDAEDVIIPLGSLTDVHTGLKRATVNHSCNFYQNLPKPIGSRSKLLGSVPLTRYQTPSPCQFYSALLTLSWQSLLRPELFYQHDCFTLKSV